VLKTVATARTLLEDVAGTGPEFVYATLDNVEHQVYEAHGTIAQQDLAAGLSATLLSTKLVQDRAADDMQLHRWRLQTCCRELAAPLRCFATGMRKRMRKRTLLNKDFTT
jgi:hypothetical protein